MKKRNWFGILENKYAKNQAYRWPLLIEDASNVMRELQTIVLMFKA